MYQSISIVTVTPPTQSEGISPKFIPRKDGFDQGRELA